MSWYAPCVLLPLPEVLTAGTQLEPMPKAWSQPAQPEEQTAQGHPDALSCAELHAVFCSVVFWAPSEVPTTVPVPSQFRRTVTVGLPMASGLSWLTILRKRENFREAFAGFDPTRVAEFDEPDVARLLSDAGIVRHQGKIRSTINNAQRALDLIEEHGSLSNYFWSWAEDERPAPTEIPATTPTSVALSKDLKKRGRSFVGPTTIYAFMQAMGLVNDHLAGCDAREACRR